MLRRTSLSCKSQHHNVLRKGRPTMHRYKEMNRWQREAQGISKWDQGHSHRQLPYQHRFNPEGVGLTKGTSSTAWKWWHTQYPWLSNVAPDGYVLPTPQGMRPPSWDDEFTDVVLSMSNDEIRTYLMEKLTDVIFEETQKDGYELRRLDFEGKPLTSLPEERIIASFVFEEETMRDRVIRRVLEGVFRLTPTSEDRKELRSVANVTDYVLTHITIARPPPVNRITEAAKDVMRRFPLQPVLGAEHALPTDDRDEILKEWERDHHLDWQFGKAVHTPRDHEEVRGNLTWLREELHYEARQAFLASVASGEARERHMQRIAQAAAAAPTANTEESF